MSGILALEPELAESSSRLIDELLDRDLVRPTERDAYEFRHILIREVAYGTLTRAERIRLHEGAGAWLEATAGEDADALAALIAYHAQEALSDGWRGRRRPGRAHRLPLPGSDRTRPHDRTADR